MYISRRFYEEQNGEGGEGAAAAAATNWRDSLPDDLKASPALANFEDVGQMAKSFVDMKSYQGNSIHIPGEDAGDEQRQQFVDKLMEKAPNVMLKPDFENQEQSREFYRTMGMPEKADQYEAPQIENMPEGAKQNEERLNFFREVAHEAGLNKGQFAKIMSKVTEADLANAQAAADAQKAGMEGLKKEWGMATQERIDAAISIAERTKAPDHLIEAMKNNAASAEVVKWMHGLSESLGSEGANFVTNEPGGDSKMTPGEAQEKIDEIYANKEHPFHRGDKAAIDKMLKLVKAANPNQSNDINDLYKGMSFNVE